MLAAQGADLRAFNLKLVLDHTSPVAMEVAAEASGFVTGCDARIIGEVIRDMGGGRITKDSVINYDVGVDRLVKPGDRIEKGFPLARLHCQDEASAQKGCARLKTAFLISKSRRRGTKLLADIVEL